MRPTIEILEEDFNVDQIDTYEADLVEAGQQSVHQDLMDAASALETALKWIEEAPAAVFTQIADTLQQVERTLTEIEG